jgi:glycosylphosphatidylinositol transamidase (GPIT) subunit GPI8
LLSLSSRREKCSCCCCCCQDVADAIQQMHEKGRYRELLLVVETCQAATLYSKIT